MDNYEERLQRCYEWMMCFHYTHCMDSYLPPRPMPRPMTELDEWDEWYHDTWLREGVRWGDSYEEWTVEERADNAEMMRLQYAAY